MEQNELKINKNEFLHLVAKKCDVSFVTTKKVYTAMIEQIKESVCEANSVSLTGFGRFSLKKHKGHRVQFEAKSDTVTDYLVLKFVASDALMSDIRESSNICAEDK